MDRASEHLAVRRVWLLSVLLLGAYPATGSTQCVDYATNSDSAIVGSVGTPGAAEDVAVSGSYAYVADGNSGLQVVNLSNPATPAIVGSVGIQSTPCLLIGYTFAVDVSGTHAYVTWDDSECRWALSVVDVSVPTSPVVVGGVDTAGPAHAVVVSGSYAYVASHLPLMPPVTAGRFRVIDVSNPVSPVILGGIDFGPGDRATGLAVSGGYAYLGASLGYGASGSLQVIDVSDPAAPMVAGSVTTDVGVGDVEVAGGYAYIVADGLRVVDVSSPTAPVIVGSLGLNGGGVEVAGNYAYVGGLTVVDISTPASPAIVGTAETDGVKAVSEDYVYATGFVDFVGELQVLFAQCESAVGVDIVSGDLGPTSLFMQSFPNPFTTSTRIDYVMPAAGRARLGLYDIHGRGVVGILDRLQVAGSHSLEWSSHDVAGRPLAPGVYFLRLEAAGEVATRKIVLRR